MRRKRLSRSELALVAVPMLLVGFGGYVQRIHRDTFSQDLQALAGENAVYCDSRECEMNAFRQKQPFWTRREEHYKNLLSCNTDEETGVSEAAVFTANGEYYLLYRYAPRGLRAARIVKRRWVNPHFISGPMGEPGLWRDAEVEVRD